MVVKLILAIIVIAIIWRLIFNLGQLSGPKKKQLTYQYILYGALAIFVLLAVTGHLHWISAAITALVAGIIRLLPIAARAAPLIFHFAGQQRNKNASRGNSSTVQSEYLKVVLDHDSESMSGKVIQGPHAGTTLAQLSKQELRELLHYYDQHDRDSYELLFAFVMRLYPNDHWQPEQEHRQQSHAVTTMSRKEALEILGLDENASATEIKRAHKQLMQRLHPDRGGSQYLAARVNQAKDYLLK